MTPMPAQPNRTRSRRPETRVCVLCRKAKPNNSRNFFTTGQTLTWRCRVCWESTQGSHTGRVPVSSDPIWRDWAAALVTIVAAPMTTVEVLRAARAELSWSHDFTRQVIAYCDGNRLVWRGGKYRRAAP
jgi:hypothetical protein